MNDAFLPILVAYFAGLVAGAFLMGFTIRTYYVLVSRDSEP